jgi:hypothetical protein
MDDNTTIERAKPQVLDGIVGFEELRLQLGVKTSRTLYYMLNRGCPSFRLGNRRMFVVEDVRRWLLQQPHASEVRKPGRPRSR